MIPHVNEKENEFEDVELKYQYQQMNRAKWYDQILLNRPFKVTVALLLVAVASPLLIYRFSFFTSLNLPPSDGYSMGSCIISRETRLPCGEGFVPEPKCHPQCCYDRNTHLCYHRIPSRFSYILNELWTEYTVLQPRISTVPFTFQNSVPKLRLSIDEESATHMIMSFYNSRNESKVGKRLYNKNYVYDISSPEMNIVVNTTDNVTQRVIFDMNRGPLIASDNIWEITFKLTNESMYGLGEIPLRRNTSKIIYHNGNDSSVPLIFAKVNNKFHGLLLDISDPTEVSIHVDNQIIIRSITNSGLKLHLFTGPEPKDIMKDVMSVIGTYNKLEYWMLGIHVCNEVPEMDLATFITNATREKMPYDSHCGHAPIVFNSDQCADSNVSNIDTVNEGARLVRNANKKFVPHVSPFIRYHKIEEDDLPEEKENVQVAINKQTRTNETVESCKIVPTFEDKMYRLPKTTDLYKGTIDDYEVIYPSYDNSDLLMKNLWAYNTQLDGIILENNWPLDLSEKMLNETSQYLPYFNENFEHAFFNTPHWNITLVNSSQPYIFNHNKYGQNFANTVSKFFDNSNKIWSSSLWMNGRFAINRQNVNVSWTNLHRELVMSALGGISGSWLWSSPICGDTENYDIYTQVSLCVKWYMAATYFPMVKIHSKTIPRYPFAYNGTHKSLMIGALQKRLGFLPYFYTTLQEGPLLRPMFYQFPSSEVLHDINTQFSVGDNLLIAPNLLPMQSHVHLWLPPGTWYELWSGLKLKGKEGDPVTMTTTESDFLTFIRGGSILILQRDITSLTAEDTRFLTPFSAIIALECTKNNVTETCKAKGKQYFTSDMTLHFSANETTMIITAEGTDFDPICDFNNGNWMYDIEHFSIYGLAEEHNNYDYHRAFTRIFDLCLLERNSQIVVNLL